VGTVVAIIETNGISTEQKETAIETKELKNEKPSTTQIGGELIDVPMPKMGESVMEGTIIKWHKKIGDLVKRDEIIFEISTDKVDTEIPSPLDGTLEEILVNEQETVEVGVVVARIKSSTGFVAVKKKEPETKQDQEQDHDHDQEINEQIVDEKIQKEETNKFFSPLVLSIARKEGISISELERIKGSGIGGRVTKNDVFAYLENKKSGKQPIISKDTTQSQEINVPKFTPGEKVKIIPMDNIRQRIMYHMVNSRDTSVHVTAVLEVDMSKVHNFINQKRDIYLQKDGIKLTYMPFISYAVIKALKEYPLLNASIDDKNIVMKNYINLGIAVAVEPNGLIVPNIKNADEKNILGLAKTISDLGLRSRTKKLTPDDVMDGTFSITNYGVFGSLFGTPIINQPEVGILGVGAVTKKPVVIENNGLESIAIKPMMYLSLSHDHRLVDGMLGGKFLMSIKQTLENFDTSIV